MRGVEEKVMKTGGGWRNNFTNKEEAGNWAGGWRGSVGR